MIIDINSRVAVMRSACRAAVTYLETAPVAEITQQVQCALDNLRVSSAEDDIGRAMTCMKFALLKLTEAESRSDIVVSAERMLHDAVAVLDPDYCALHKH